MERDFPSAGVPEKKLLFEIEFYISQTHHGFVLEQLKDTVTSFLRTILSLYGYLSSMAKRAFLAENVKAVRGCKSP